MRYSFANLDLQCLDWGTAAGNRSGAVPSPSPSMRPSSSAAEDTAWRPPIISPRNTACATSQWSRGWLGGGNTGRNTTVIRSNYLWDESAALYEHALELWEGLSRELNYNVMYSPRGH